MSAYTYARQYIKSIRYFNLKFMGQKKNENIPSFHLMAPPPPPPRPAPAPGVLSVPAIPSAAGGGTQAFVSGRVISVCSRSSLSLKIIS